MQPPNLKGGDREENPWSCYDPNRPEKEDYNMVRMPSQALTAVLEGDLLETEEDPQPTGNSNIIINKN